MYTKLQLNNSIIYRKTDFGGAILNDRSGQYWQLNKSSALIFDLLMNNRKLNEIVQEICENFDGINAHQAKLDVDSCLEEFREAGFFS